MPVPVILPKFGFTLETADIVQWLKKDGDTVRAGDPICEVTTDKVNMEVEAPEAGTIFNVLYDAGATVPVTDVICYLLRPGEARPEQVAASSSKAMPPAPVVTQRAVIPTQSDINATPVAQRMATAAQLELSRVRGTGPNSRITRRDVEALLAGRSNGDKVRATPAARRLAAENAVDLRLVVGSGPRGRIQRDDVQAAVALAHAPGEANTAETAPDSAKVVQSATPSLPAPDAPKVVKLEGMRRTIAMRLQKSFQTAPHIFFDAQVDMSAIETLRRRVKERGEKLSVTAIVVKACASTLLRHPWLNATIEGEEVSLWPTINVGVAVALDVGLVVPVVKHAERRTMSDIQVALDELASRARDNVLHLNDVMGGTFTVSNLGMYGVDRFTAIINPPQVAILAVGRTQRLFVPDENDQPVLRSFMNITLSADHRVVDGANAAAFLQDLRSVLEEPGLLAW
jgi:pyruvate dehydrogenase E2 component (dihydrolipoamide acetyltransferase)